MLVYNKTLVASLEDAIVDLRALLWLAVPILQNIGAVEVPLATFWTPSPLLLITYYPPPPLNALKSVRPPQPY
jgi:hypothetical protein